MSNQTKALKDLTSMLGALKEEFQGMDKTLKEFLAANVSIMGKVQTVYSQAERATGTSIKNIGRSIHGFTEPMDEMMRSTERVDRVLNDLTQSVEKTRASFAKDTFSASDAKEYEKVVSKILAAEKELTSAEQEKAKILRECGVSEDALNKSYEERKKLLSDLAQTQKEVFEMESSASPEKRQEARNELLKKELELIKKIKIQQDELNASVDEGLKKKLAESKGHGTAGFFNGGFKGGLSGVQSGIKSKMDLMNQMSPEARQSLAKSFGIKIGGDGKAGLSGMGRMAGAAGDIGSSGFKGAMGKWAMGQGAAAGAAGGMGGALGAVARVAGPVGIAIAAVKGAYDIFEKIHDFTVAQNQKVVALGGLSALRGEGGFGDAAANRGKFRESIAEAGPLAGFNYTMDKKISALQAGSAAGFSNARMVADVTREGGKDYQSSGLGHGQNQTAKFMQSAALTAELLGSNIEDAAKEVAEFREEFNMTFESITSFYTNMSVQARAAGISTSKFIGLVKTLGKDMSIYGDQLFNVNAALSQLGRTGSYTSETIKTGFKNMFGGNKERSFETQAALNSSMTSKDKKGYKSIVEAEILTLEKQIEELGNQTNPDGSKKRDQAKENALMAKKQQLNAINKGDWVGATAAGINDQTPMQQLYTQMSTVRLSGHGDIADAALSGNEALTKKLLERLDPTQQLMLQKKLGGANITETVGGAYDLRRGSEATFLRNMMQGDSFNDAKGTQLVSSGHISEKEKISLAGKTGDELKAALKKLFASRGMAEGHALAATLNEKDGVQTLGQLLAAAQEQKAATTNLEDKIYNKFEPIIQKLVTLLDKLLNWSMFSASDEAQKKYEDATRSDKTQTDVRDSWQTMSGALGGKNTAMGRQAARAAEIQEAQRLKYGKYMTDDVSATKWAGVSSYKAMQETIAGEQAGGKQSETAIAYDLLKQTGLLNEYKADPTNASSVGMQVSGIAATNDRFIPTGLARAKATLKSQGKSDESIASILEKMQAQLGFAGNTGSYDPTTSRLTTAANMKAATGNVTIVVQGGASTPVTSSDTLAGVKPPPSMKKSNP